MTTLRNIVSLTTDDRERADTLLALVSAHLTLVDPDDRQGARWVVAEAVRLAEQYGFDEPGLVGQFVADAIL